VPLHCCVLWGLHPQPAFSVLPSICQAENPPMSAPPATLGQTAVVPLSAYVDTLVNNPQTPNPESFTVHLRTNSGESSCPWHCTHTECPHLPPPPNHSLTPEPPSIPSLSPAGPHLHPPLDGPRVLCDGVKHEAAGAPGGLHAAAVRHTIIRHLAGCCLKGLRGTTGAGGGGGTECWHVVWVARTGGVRPRSLTQI
jgi:hypothetical protein